MRPPIRRNSARTRRSVLAATCLPRLLCLMSDEEVMPQASDSDAINLRSSDVNLIPIMDDLSSCCCFFGLDILLTASLIRFYGRFFGLLIITGDRFTWSGGKRYNVDVRKVILV